MSNFHAVRVSDIIRETPDCVSIGFGIPKNLAKEFEYKAGQHVIVRKILGDEDVRRTYSFCSAPSSGHRRIAVRHVEGGAFSTFANTKLKVGDTLEISTPIGEFTLPTDARTSSNYVAFAVGSGITPIMAMIREVLTREPNSHFFLYYGNRDAEHTIFAEQLAHMKNLHMERFSYQFFMTRQVVDIPFFNGRITGDKASILHQNVFSKINIDEYYLCGPLSMIDGVREALVNAGETAENIHSELFFAGADSERANKRSALDGLAKSKVTVISDGRKIEVDYRDEHGSILEATLKSGIDVSFACKGGVCATCRAKVTEGKVDMALNYGLEPEEIEAGFVLTCQSIPLTKTVTISFDE
ncbi:MAG: 2Fe-2S iron-sulfur cluster binding domain-containing protein [Robiginitomaculum sp.]|nr:2Fe-2S iron-sulfur cluster binding domain-containing protein [Robiginitomaculum sp.]